MQNNKNISEFITDAIIGLSDGLTVPFALAAGLSGALLDNNLILTAGIAEVVAGSIAMGLGGYLSGKTEQEFYTNEYQKLHDENTIENESKTKQAMQWFDTLGIDEAGKKILAKQVDFKSERWVEFFIKMNVGIEKPHPNRARNAALTIGFAYFAGGLLPLSAYMMTSKPNVGLLYSLCITTLCLLMFGYVKSKITGQNPILGAIYMAVIGLLAAAAAYAVAKAALLWL